jgi:hypothetical protein
MHRRAARVAGVTALAAAECIASFSTDHRCGLCTDLDGDGYAGCPDE